MAFESNNPVTTVCGILPYVLQQFNATQRKFQFPLLKTHSCPFSVMTSDIYTDLKALRPSSFTYYYVLLIMVKQFLSNHLNTIYGTAEVIASFDE